LVPFSLRCPRAIQPLAAMAPSLTLLLFVAAASLGRTAGAAEGEGPRGDAQGLAVLVATDFAIFPGYPGPLRVAGALFLAEAEPEQITADLALVGLDPGCGASFLGRKSVCEVRFHKGSGCTDLGAAIPSDAVVGEIESKGAGWLSGNMAVARAVFSDARTVVVTDRHGVPVACSPLTPFVAPDHSEVVVSEWQRYPGYTGRLQVEGKAILYAAYRASDKLAAQVLTLDSFRGLDPACGSSTTASGPNVCGIHVHAGHGCGSADAVGGHFWDAALVSEDPWAPLRLHPEILPLQTPVVVTGLGRSQILGRTLVVHDAAGARVACAVIPDAAAAKEPGASTPTRASSLRAALLARRSKAGGA